MSDKKIKKIIINTGFLYIYLLLTMAVSLYTSRVVLNTLGIEDFGIYNVVGGFVTMLGFLNSAMVSSTQRFLSFELGKKDKSQLNNIFSMSLSIHLLIALLILILGETVGLWFISTQLTIPSERMPAAEWVYHFSLLAFLISVITTPFNASIIAHERMKIFAGVSLIDVTLKLLIVFILQWFGFDKLKFYAVLTCAVVLIISLIYITYCKTHFQETRLRLYWNGSLFKTMLSYSGWNLWGNIAAVMSNQGINILLNIFFGPIVNAAQSIAFQVNSALNSFIQNLQIAINPQIIKNYSANNFQQMQQLVFYGAKYNFFLLLTLSLPILLETKFILYIWLGNTPE